MSGVAKAVQAIPAAVEGLVMGHPYPPRAPVTGEADGYASAQSGSPDTRRPPPPVTPSPTTPLLDERALQTLSGHQVAAPHLYAPEAPMSGGKPPSATSSDIQAEVRRQLQEVMLARDEENAALRSRLDVLISENQVLRQEIAGQMYSSEAVGRSESHGAFNSLGWIGRGIGNFMSGVASPKPFSPVTRLMAFRPPPPPHPSSSTSGLEVPVSSGEPGMRTELRTFEAPKTQIVESPTASGMVHNVDLQPTQRALDFSTVARETPSRGAEPGHPRPPEPSGTSEAPHSSPPAPDPLNVVLTGMAQLQGVVAGLAASPKAIPKQETIKPGVTSLPELPEPGPEACLKFADWLHASKPALSDVSDSSEEFWDMILKESSEWYAKHIKLDPITRLTDRPKVSEGISNPRWARVSRRIETMVLAAAPSQVRDEISAARVTGLLAVISRLYVIYSPGGLGEREIGLRNIQEPTAGSGVRDTIELLRRWRRWCDRMVELGGTVPDSALRVRALDRITKAVLHGHPDVAFRVNLMRASLQIDSTPSDHKVDQLHAQMLAELEALNHRVSTKDPDKAKDSNPSAAPKIKGVEPSDNTGSPKNPKPPKAAPKLPTTPKVASGSEVAGQGGIPCSFYVGHNGCKKGADCSFVHNWSAFSQAEKAARCKICGSKGHKSNECRAGVKGEEKAKYKSPTNAKANTFPKVNEAAAPTVAPPPPTKELSQQQIKSMLADAAQIIQQAAVPSPGNASRGNPAVPISPPSASPVTGATQASAQQQAAVPVTPGTPVTLAALSAQLEALQAMARNHEVRMIEVTPEVTKAIEKGDMCRALLDSGATHAVVPFSKDMKGLEKVSVTLAGDSKEEWLKTAGGTLVVPPQGGDQDPVAPRQTILPLGALVQTLGCKVTWSKRKGLRVVHPVLGPLRTGVSSNTCPYLQEDQALKLIGELESERLKEFELSVQAMEADLRQISQPSDPTESLRKYALTGSRKDLIQAVFSQPYLHDVPEAIKVRMCEELPGVDDKSGWKLLKRLPLNRAKRRTLHGSMRWVVSLCSGPTLETDPIGLWCQDNNLQFLPIDILGKGGKGWDLTLPGGVWSVLLWAASTGRIVSVLSSPPHRTWFTTGMTTDRSVANPWGTFEAGDQGFKESLIAIQDMFLWSLASVARGSAIPFLKELPSHGHNVSDPSVQRVHPGLFWKTDIWHKFSAWSRTGIIEFCQGSLGHSWLHPTAIATNLPLHHLSGLPKRGSPEPPPNELSYHTAAWSIGFRKEVVEALAGHVKGPTVEELDRVIADALSSKEESSDETVSSEALSQVSAPSYPNGQVGVLHTSPSEVSVSALSPVQREEWRSHIIRGHMPYRKDCKFCVEGAGLGIQHRRAKNPQAYTLSVDLFGPMTGPEKGRDEQSVSANPHLKFGLVGAFRFPKSAITLVSPPTEEPGSKVAEEGQTFFPLEGELEDYEPSIPEDVGSDAEPFPELLVPSSEKPPTSSQINSSIMERALQFEDPESSGAVAPLGEREWLDDVELDAHLKDLTSGVELVSLRYMIGLKSKTGADVTAGVQKLILTINKLFPVKVLHCDPGTEFGSDKLAAWLAQQGVRLQTTVPTDKQGNGVAERTVGWLKSRARTLLAASRQPSAYWPLAMRWAAESHNRQVLGQPPLPAFGQPVFHKLKRASGATKELMVRWITASYAAPHLTIPEGHVLMTEDGSLVASRGFRTNLIDTTVEPGLELPALQTKDDPPDPDPMRGVNTSDSQLDPVADSPATKGRRVRGKTAVRFLEIKDWGRDTLSRLAQHALLDDDFSEATFRRLAAHLEDTESSSQDRRGEFTGRYVFGAFCHGGQRGITSLARTPVVSFLNKFLKKRMSGECNPEERQWATVMLLHASDVPVHRDYRNEWNTTNAVVHVPEQLELWAGPPKEHKDLVRENGLDWTSERVQELGPKAVTFNPRNFHAVRCNHGWVIVGYTPLGIHKVQEEDKAWLWDVGFELPCPNTECVEVKALRYSLPSLITSVANSSSSIDQPESQIDHPPSNLPDSQPPVDLTSDLQPDSVTAFVGWDPNGGNRSNIPQENLEEADLYEFLCGREVEWTLARLQFVGVESPADLYYLYMEDLIELGFPEEDARSIMRGIHPEGTVRPDNPNGISLRTGEVRLLDRGQRQIPWAIQNRTLGLKRPGPPVMTLQSVPDRVSPEVTQAPAFAVDKVLESSFTPNVEELLEGLAGPLEVVHQVSPAEVKRHLEKWKPSAQDEVDSMENMRAIHRCRGAEAKALLNQPGVEVLPAKGVFTVKPGKPFRRKVRVVSCGNFAKSVAEDVLYASGAAAETLRTLLVQSGVQRRQCWSTDIKCAFLLAPIPENVQKRYVLKPPSVLVALGICTPDEYWEVCRAVYGFKEAPKWWAQYRDKELAKGEFTTPLGTAKLKRAVSDENLWEIVLDNEAVIGHILVYVDDLLVLGSKGTAESVHRWVSSMWSCSDLEKASAHKPLRFLGIDIYEVNDEYGVCGFTLSQEGYIDELVRSHALEVTPRAMVPVPKEWVKDAPPEETEYSEATLREAQKITGELLWLSQRTRIDVAFGVGLMSSWTVRSPSYVTRVGLRILSYLANTKRFRLSLVPNGPSELTVYSDASFAPFGERSVSGIVVLLRGRCVLWKSRRQSLMSLSTAECELIAACEAVTLAQSLESLVAELLKVQVAKVLQVDNVAAIVLVEGGGSQRTRHLRVCAHFLRELVDSHELRVLHCPGEVQLADALTKALAAPRLKTLSELLGIGEQPIEPDPAVSAVMTASDVFQNIDPAEGQSMMLVLALLMAQVRPAASQDDEEEQYDGVSLDLWIVGSLLAFFLLIVWELGKHCLRQCCLHGHEARVNTVTVDDEKTNRRQRRQEAVRRALEKETSEGLRYRSSASSSGEGDIAPPSAYPERSDEGLWDPLADLGPRKKQKGPGPKAAASSGRVSGPPEGTAVILQGLSKAPQLNGKSGTVAGNVDGATGRCPVLLIDGSVKSLKVENLRQVLTGTIEANLEKVCQYLQPRKYLASQSKPFTWKGAIQKGKEREQSWSSRLTLFKDFGVVNELGLPAPRFLPGQDLAAAKDVAPAAIAADSLPLTEEGRLACRLLAVSTERDAGSPAKAPQQDLKRLAALAKAVQKRDDTNTPTYFLLPGLCTEALPCARSSATMAWPMYLQLCQALVCLESAHHAHKAWCRADQLIASQVLSQPVYLLAEAGVKASKAAKAAADSGEGSWLLSDCPEVLSTGAPGDGQLLPAERPLLEQICGVLPGGRLNAGLFNLTNLLPKCRRLVREQLGKQNLHRPVLGLLDARPGCATARKGLWRSPEPETLPSDEPPADSRKDWPSGGGDGWGIFFLPTGQALVLDDAAYRETLARGTLLDLQDIGVPQKDEDSSMLEAPAIRQARIRASRAEGSHCTRV
eukprot:s3022_g3.t1